MRKMIILISLLLLLTVNIFAEIPQMIPNTFVQDHTGILNDNDKQQINERLKQFKIKYQCEFGLVIVKNTEDRPISDYSLEIARTYGIGSKDNEQRGILLLISLEDLRYRFEISRHMESMLTDGQAGSIGRDVLIPRAKIASKVDSSLQSVSWRNTILATIDTVDKVVSKRYEPEIVSNTPVPVGASNDPTVTIVALIVLGVLGVAIMLVLGGMIKRL